MSFLFWWGLTMLLKPLQESWLKRRVFLDNKVKSHISVKPQGEKLTG